MTHWRWRAIDRRAGDRARCGRRDSSSSASCSCLGHSQLVLFDEVGTLLATDPERLSKLRATEPPAHAVGPSITPFHQAATGDAARPALLHHSCRADPGNGSGSGVAGQPLPPSGRASPFYSPSWCPLEVSLPRECQDVLHALAWVSFAGLLLLSVCHLAGRPAQSAAPLLVLTGEAERIQHFDFGEARGRFGDPRN